MNNIREFHRSKALENINIESFHDVVENMAKILDLSDDRKEEIKLAANSDTMVNALEDFEHGFNGHYSYGKYQTRKHPNGNMDVVFALHALRFELLLDEEYLPEGETRIATKNEVGTALSSSERIKWKMQFRAEAMRTFEDDCPHQLLTEMGIKDQQEVRQQARRKEEEKMKN